jgi:hypothetical protein
LKSPAIAPGFLFLRDASCLRNMILQNSEHVGRHAIGVMWG